MLQTATCWVDGPTENSKQDLAIARCRYVNVLDLDIFVRLVELLLHHHHGMLFAGRHAAARESSVVCLTFSIGASACSSSDSDPSFSPRSAVERPKVTTHPRNVLRLCHV